MELSIKEIVINAIKEKGADGLCSAHSECGCGINNGFDNFMPCGAPNESCVLARLDPKKAKDEDCDEWYSPIDFYLGDAKC